jgi:2-methylcitrate dehydratase PrpD
LQEVPDLSHSDPGTERRLLDLADFAVRLTRSEIPPDVVHSAKRALLDVIGVTIAGAETQTARVVRELVAEEYAEGPCTVLGGLRSQPSGAAFANGVSAHALDFDDTSYSGIVHASAVVLPAVLAIAEKQHKSGSELLVAFVAGIEAELFLGRILTNYLYERGWWTTALLGTMGAAVGAAKVLGVAAPQAREALSLAAGSAAGLGRSLGTAGKPYYVGRAAAAGQQAASVAARGRLRMPDMFCGQANFVSLFNNDVCELEALDDLGQVYALQDPGIAFKLYPVCSAAQAAVEAVKAVICGEGLLAREVGRVRCEVTPLVYSSLRYDRPSSVEEAQFSLPFAVGCMIAFGEMGPSQLNAELLRDRTLLRAMEVVEMVPSVDFLAEGESLDQAPEGARVTVETTDGRVFERTNPVASGMPSRPLSDADLKRKFHACVGRTRTEAEADRLLERIWNLESISAAELLAPLSRGE